MSEVEESGPIGLRVCALALYALVDQGPLKAGRARLAEHPAESEAT